MRIEWAETAETDLDEIFEYIARDAPVYAEQYIDRILDTVSTLHDHPKIGRTVREANQDHVRELIFQSHRIIYAIEPERIVILTVIHGRRDLDHLPDQPWDDD